MSRPRWLPRPLAWLTLRRLIFGVLGAAAVVVTLMGWQQLVEDRRALAEQLALNRQEQASARFITAVEQLGSDRAEVQLDGVHALEQIARQAPDTRPVVIEILAAYVRGVAPATGSQPPAAPPTTAAASAPPPEPAAPSSGIEAAMAVLSQRHAQRTDPLLDLRGANLSGAKLPGVRLSVMDLRDADLRGANLQSAFLNDVDLGAADLYGANLSEAKLRTVDLAGADLSEAKLRAADLSAVGLDGADLSGADLQSASLTAVALAGADLSGASLDGADLTDTHLTDAIADDSTDWPDGFDWRAAGVQLDSG